MVKDSNIRSKLIVFVGAGASAGLGMPTTLQFIELLNKHWTNLNVVLDAYRKYCQSSNVLNKNQTIVDSEYLRDWFLELKRSGESIQVLSQNKPFRTNISPTQHAVQFIDEAITDFDLFTRSCYTDHHPDKAYQHYFPLLDWLFLHRINTVPLFTTNYDLVFESIQDCESCKWDIITGTRKTGRRVILDTKLYDEFNHETPTIIVYKLHGSTDWWLNIDTNQIYQIPLDNKAPANCRDLLIYPTRSKFEKVNEKPFSFYYERLKTYLSSEEIRACITIGYSFRDEYINNIFVESLKKGLKLFIIDKNMRLNQFKNEFSSYNIDDFITNNVKIHNFEFGNWQQNPTIRNRFTKMLDEEFLNILDTNR